MNCKPGDLAIIQPPDDCEFLDQVRGLIVTVTTLNSPGIWGIKPRPIIKTKNADIELLGCEDRHLLPIRGVGTPSAMRKTKPVAA